MVRKRASNYRCTSLNALAILCAIFETDHEKDHGWREQPVKSRGLAFYYSKVTVPLGASSSCFGVSDVTPRVRSTVISRLRAVGFARQQRAKKRRLDSPSITSGLARSTDIIRQSRLVRLVPEAVIRSKRAGAPRRAAICRYHAMGPVAVVDINERKRTLLSHGPKNVRSLP
jgi:hypothetical protein